MTKGNTAAFLILAALAGSLGACSSTSGSHARFALTAQSKTPEPEAAQLAAEIQAEAWRTGKFRQPKRKDRHIITYDIESIQPMTFENGDRGYTYLVSWYRDGVQGGQQKGDCRTREINVCAKAAVELIYQQLIPAKR